MDGDEPDDAELVQHAAQGDTDAFSQLFHRHYSMIYAFAYRLCLDRSDAQDIAQEAFVKAARALASFTGKSSFKSWLYRIALNSARDSHRSKARRGRLAEELLNESPDVDSVSTTDHAPVTEALRALPDDLRQAIVLTIYEDMTHAEAARVMGCAEATISWRVFRAKRKLKQLLSRSHE